jgi:Domain of unknown function (DUF5666)
MLTRRAASVLVIAALALGAVALPAQAALRHIDGTVISKNADNNSFRITTQNGNRLRIKVTSSTRFERIAGGFSGLRKGLEVEVDARRTANGLVATEVETRGGGDDHGGGGGGGDDGPNHT